MAGSDMTDAAGAPQPPATADTEMAAPDPRTLSPAALRALAEAEERRRAADQAATGKAGAGPAAPLEVGGRKGPDPVRYGDWEKAGIVSDF